MRILQVHNHYQHAGGEDAVVCAENTLLKKEGNEVLLYEVNNNSIQGIVSKLKVALSVSYSASSRDSLIRELDTFEPDIVHVHNFFPILTPAIYDACHNVGVPVVQTLHNYRTVCPGALLMRDGHVCEDCITGSAYQSVLYGCYRNSHIGSFILARMIEAHRNRQTWQNKVERYIALTKFAKEKFIQAGFPEQKIAIKSNFVVSDNIDDITEINCSYALYVGRLSKEKGIKTLLHAWTELSMPLHIVGDGPLLKKVRSVESDKIICFGRMSSQDVGDQMAKARFLVMPSEWYEGFPMVLVEAFARGIPVIVSSLGSMAEIVEDRKMGLHFEAGNVQDLIEKVRWMQNHPEACKKMGDYALKVYLEKYTPVSNYKILMQIYHDAIGEYR